MLILEVSSGELMLRNRLRPVEFLDVSKTPGTGVVGLGLVESESKSGIVEVLLRLLLERLRAGCCQGESSSWLLK